MSTAVNIAERKKTMPNQLAQLDKARQMLAESRTLFEVKSIRDKAEAAKVYAKAANLGQESQNYAAEIALLAARKAGEILQQLERTSKQSAATVSGDSEYRQTLDETGTPERTAQRWQKLADIPQPVFENYISAAKEKRQDITTSGLLKAVPTSKPQSKPQTLNRPIHILRHWIKTECLGLDAVIQPHISYGSDSPNFNLEIRDISADEVKAVCETIVARRNGKEAA